MSGHQTLMVSRMAILGDEDKLAPNCTLLEVLRHLIKIISAALLNGAHILGRFNLHMGGLYSRFPHFRWLPTAAESSSKNGSDQFYELL